MVYFCIKISKKNKEEKKIEKCHFWKKLTQINSLAQNPTQESPKFRPKDQSSLLAVGPTHNSQKPPSCDTWRGLVLPRVNSSSAASVRSQATRRPPIQAVNERTDPEATPPRPVRAVSARSPTKLPRVSSMEIRTPPLADRPCSTRLTCAAHVPHARRCDGRAPACVTRVLHRKRSRIAWCHVSHFSPDFNATFPLIFTRFHKIYSINRSTFQASKGGRKQRKILP